jgi:uncharacterized protein YcfL
VKCSKCGKENDDNSKFCNECGSKLEEQLEDNKSIDNSDAIEVKEPIETITEVDKPKLKSRIKNLSLWKKVLISCIIIFSIIGIVEWNKEYKQYKYDTGYGLSYDEKELNVQIQLNGGNYEKAMELCDTYDILNDDIGKIVKVYKENPDKVYSIIEVKEIISAQEKMNNCTVVKTEAKAEMSGYNTIYTTIKNNSKNDINYVKLNIYFYDKNGNTVKSDWTNDDSRIKPGATQILEKIVKQDGTWSKYKVEVAEYH